MPKLNETKYNKNWISQNHGKFNEMQKIMFWNARNGSQILENLKVQKTLYVVKNISGPILDHCWVRLSHPI